VPELPEVETVRRQLAPRLEGRTIDDVRVIDARWCDPAPPAEVEAALRGRRIERVWRRGKYIVCELEDDVHLVMHLRMTGNFFVRPGDARPEPHERVLFALDDGSKVAFRDVRRFGTGVVLFGSDARDDYFAARLGVEPLDADAFTAEALRALAKGRRAPVKAFLLNQERIAGVGNIYADEALWRARIHPQRAVGTLKRAQLAELRDAVVAVLEAGIDARGASIDDFRNVDGAMGSSQDRFEVYGRAGEPCSRCRRPITKLARVAGRGTYVCERCQPKPRRRAAQAA
jgi:formamidopyrimidine-DNA glycosylase